MSEQGWAGFIGEVTAGETPGQKASRLALQQAERADRRELAAEAERRAAIEDDHDRRMMAYHQLGIAGRSAGQVFADASKAGDEDAEYEAARATVERIDRRRARRAEAARFQAEQVAAVASRSEHPDDMLKDAKRTLAAMRLEAELQAGAPVSAPRARRPFVSRSAGIVRSEHCVHCIDQGVSDEDSYLLHSDPELAVPVTPPQASEAYR